MLSTIGIVTNAGVGRTDTGPAEAGVGPGAWVAIVAHLAVVDRSQRVAVAFMPRWVAGRGVALIAGRTAVGLHTSHADDCLTRFTNETSIAVIAFDRLVEASNYL